MRIFDYNLNNISKESVVFKTTPSDPIVIWDAEYEFHGIDNVDSYTKTQTSPIEKITPQGTSDPEVLKQAPKPDVTIAGERKKAGIVVDIGTNVLYTYDSKGNATKAYLIASGKKVLRLIEG